MGVTFVDTARAPLTNPAGSLSAELATDRWHLSGEGYGILAEWLLEASPALRAHLRVK
jgi:lysophospholipase L1-like esterase